MKINLKVVVIAILSVAIVVGYYFYLANRPETTAESNTTLTEVETLLTMDLENNYPKTPREVTKLFTRIQKAVYNEEYTDEQLEGLAEMLFTLMDEELQENNPLDTFVVTLQLDAAAYEEDGRIISNVVMEESTDVVYRVIEDRECAYVDVTYYIREGNSTLRTYQTFILREEKESGYWKVLTFYETNSESDE